MRLLNLKDRTFGDWTVLSQADSTARGAARWNCKCTCGTERPVLGTLLRNGESRSCGECGIRLTAEEKETFEVQRRKEETARETLANPDASVTARETAERILRNAPKHREALEARVRERKQTAIAEKSIEKSATALELLQAKYPEIENLPVGPERDELLQSLNAELPALTGPSLSGARRWVLGRIAELEDAIKQEQAAIAAQHAEQEKRQALIDQFACNSATTRIMDKISPVLRTNNLPLEKRQALLNYCRTMQKNAKEYAKAAAGVDGSGARRDVVAKHIESVYRELVDRLQPFTFNPNVDATSTSKWMNQEWADTALLPDYFAFRTLEEKCHVAYALRLYYRNNGMAAELASIPNYPEPIWNPEPPHQSLDGVIARANLSFDSSWEREEQLKEQEEALERLRVTNSKAYKELLKKGPDFLETWKRMTADERRELEKTNWKKARTFKEVEKYLRPIDTSVPCNIYKVPVFTLENPKLSDELYWPTGEKVRVGIEIVYDFMLKAWVLAPQPACADPDFSGGNRKMECVQDDWGNWVKRPVDKEARWEQDATGHWVQINASASKRWAAPQKITFLKGDRHVPGSGRDFFRYGQWWAAEEIAKAESGWTEQPPSILPPIKPCVADSIATVPTYKEDRWEAEKLRQWGPA